MQQPQGRTVAGGPPRCDHETPLPEFYSLIRPECIILISAALNAATAALLRETVAAILAPAGISLGEFFGPFATVTRPKTPRRKDYRVARDGSDDRTA